MAAFSVYYSSGQFALDLPDVFLDDNEKVKSVNTRLGNFLYGVGLTAAAIVILYTVDVIWVHGSGSSLLPISGRFVSREEMLITSVVGFTVTLLLWGAGALVRNIVNKAAESEAANNKPRGNVSHR